MSRVKHGVIVVALLSSLTAFAGELEMKKAWDSVDKAFKDKNADIAKVCGKKLPLDYDKPSFDGMDAKHIAGGYTSSPTECLEVGTQITNFICSEKANAPDAKAALLSKVKTVICDNSFNYDKPGKTPTTVPQGEWDKYFDFKGGVVRVHLAPDSTRYFIDWFRKTM